MANIIYSMIQPFKVQWEAKNSENAGFYTFRACMRAARAILQIGRSHFVGLGKTLLMVPLDYNSGLN